MSTDPKAFFLPLDEGRNGQRFCLFHPARGNLVHGSILYVHPFAEEMNKSRRMAALQARALALAGYAVLQLDLLGCGDSSGDFGDATWLDWLSDVRNACHWLQDRINAPLWIWGLRSGCLLGAEAAQQLTTRCNFIFWAPMLAGKVQLQQFMRLKAAGNLASGNAKGVTEELRLQLASGTAVEIAGYILSPGAASGLEKSVLAPPGNANSPETPRLEWFEMSTREDAILSPLSAKTAEQWVQAGFLVRREVVNGASFWQTNEVEEAPSLIAATVAAISDRPKLVAA